jgi:hypothetical protein
MKVFGKCRWRGLRRGVFLALALCPSVGLAQLTNNEVPIGRTVPRQEQIEGEMGSRFRLGSVRLLPQIAFVGPTYDNNVLGATGDEAKVSDWTFTVSAGLGVLIPLGKKMYLRGVLFPQYIYYDRLAERRQWGGSYGGSLYGFFNRMSVEADYLDQRTPQYPNSEIQTQVLGDTQAGNLKVEVDLGGPWSVFANGQYQQISYRSLGAPPPIINGVLSLLDRNEGAVRGGVRYKLKSYFTVGIGAEGTRTTFTEDPQRGDNESNAVYASVHYDRPRLFVNFSGGYRTSRPINGSNFSEFSTFTGSGYISYALLSQLDLNVYGKRGIQYGVFIDNPYYLEALAGGGLTLHLGRRVEVNGFGGYGTNDYPVPIASAGGVKRVDKVTVYGGGLSALVYKSISLQAQVTSTEYNSNIAAFDRKVLRFSTGLVVGVLSP